MANDVEITSLSLRFKDLDLGNTQQVVGACDTVGVGRGGDPYWDDAGISHIPLAPLELMFFDTHLPTHATSRVELLSSWASRARSPSQATTEDTKEH